MESCRVAVHHIRGRPLPRLGGPSRQVILDPIAPFTISPIYGFSRADLSRLSATRLIIDQIPGSSLPAEVDWPNAVLGQNPNEFPIDSRLPTPGPLFWRIFLPRMEPPENPSLIHSNVRLGRVGRDLSFGASDFFFPFMTWFLFFSSPLPQSS